MVARHRSLGVGETDERAQIIQTSSYKVNVMGMWCTVWYMAYLKVAKESNLKSSHQEKYFVTMCGCGC